MRGGGVLGTGWLIQGRPQAAAVTGEFGEGKKSSSWKIICSTIK